MLTQICTKPKMLCHCPQGEDTLSSAANCPLISSVASWKVDITLSHWKKLAASPLEFVPVEPADMSEGSQSWGCCQVGGGWAAPFEYHVIGNGAAQGLKGAVGRAEALHTPGGCLSI